MSELTSRANAKPFARSWYGTLLWLLGGLGLAGCNDGDRSAMEAIRVNGRTMGTSYSLIAVPSGKTATPAATVIEEVVDSLLAAINAEVNTYDASSLISRLNDGGEVELPVIQTTDRLHSRPGAHFSANLTLATEPYRVSGGAFDPTVGPLVEYYGFGAGFVDASAVDTAEVARLRQLVGFDKITFDTAAGGEAFTLAVAREGVRLDLSAVAKGYAVDQIGLLLAERYGLRDYFVEIGGETVMRGDSPRGTPWTIGINAPREGAALDDLEIILSLSDAAVATSGNYRNVRIRGGRRYVHTVDPLTGRAEPSRLLSATVVAPDCATADAYATACMASGEDAEAVLAAAGLSGCLIFAGPGQRFDTRYVGDFGDFVVADQSAD